MINRDFISDQYAKDRVILRTPTMEDVEVLTDKANDPIVLDRMLNMPRPFTHETAQTIVARAQNMDPLEGRILVIVETALNQLIGMVGMRFHDGHSIPTLGYWIGSAYHGKGYMSEAIGILIRDILPDFRFAMLRANVEPDNIASIRVLEKNGFRAMEMGTVNMPSGKIIAVRWYQLNLMPYRGFETIRTAKPLSAMAVAAE